MNAKDSQCLKDTNISRPLKRIGQLGLGTALQADAMPFQTHPPPKQLNDLGTFTSTHIHQTHGGYPPTAPTFGEFLRTNQYIDARMGTINLEKQRTRKLALPGLQTVCLTQSDEFRIIAYIHHSKSLIFRAKAQRNFTVRTLQIFNIELAASGCIEQRPQRVIENLSGS